MDEGDDQQFNLPESALPDLRLTETEWKTLSNDTTDLVGSIFFTNGRILDDSYNELLPAFEIVSTRTTKSGKVYHVRWDGYIDTIKISEKEMCDMISAGVWSARTIT